jgi:hypothetical protein
VKRGPGLDPTVPREPLHRRTIEIQGYKREDGLYDIEGHLVDTKPYDFKLAAGLRPAGEPIHGMWLRITVDKALTIVDAAAAMDAMPYISHCDQIVPAYRALVGLAIRPGYHQRVKELLGGVRGCTHITEMAGALATAAFQTMAGQRVQDPDRKPFQLGRCHALAETGAVVGRYYPKWYKGTEAVAPADEGDHH